MVIFIGLLNKKNIHNKFFSKNQFNRPSNSFKPPNSLSNRPSNSFKPPNSLSNRRPANLMETDHIRSEIPQVLAPVPPQPSNIPKSSLKLKSSLKSKSSFKPLINSSGFIEPLNISSLIKPKKNFRFRSNTITTNIHKPVTKSRKMSSSNVNS
jgi:hypothetical protein